MSSTRNDTPQASRQFFDSIGISFTNDGPDHATVLDEIALSAEEGGRDPSDAPRYKGLKQKARHAAAVLADAEIECGTPKERELATLTDASEAAKAALGPKMAAKAIAKAALAESIAALAALPASTDLQHRTKVRHAVAMIERELARAEDDLAKAEAMYNETIRPVVSARISTMLVESAALFDDQYAQIEQATVEDMVSAAEDIANVGGLAPGDIVHVDVGGAFVKAKVVGACPNRPKPGGEEEGPVSYDVLLEEETTLLGSEYSKEFKTPMTVARPRMYAEDPELRQPAAPAGAGIAGRMEHAMAAGSAATEPMATLIESTLAAGESAGLGPRPAGITVLKGPRKARARAWAKIFEKYLGEIERLLDITRLTVVCRTAEGVAWVLRAFRCGKLDFPRFKNRLHPAFRADDETGGYRDMLGNLRLPGSGTIVEIQVTTVPMLSLKSSVAHGVYRIGRVIDALSRTVWRLRGALSPEALARLTAGMLRAVEVPGSTVAPAPLVRALAAPAAHLTVLDLTACAGLAGVRLDAVLTAAVVAQLAPTVRFISLHSCQVTGAIPAWLGQCRRLRTLQLQKNRFGGEALPPGLFAGLAELRVLHVHTCGLVGPVPRELAACTQMEDLALSMNKLDGGLPGAVFAAMPGLKQLRLDENGFAGPVPRELAACTQMESLYLDTNKLDGGLPGAVFAAMPGLKELWLSANGFTGPVPRELAACTQMEKLHLRSNKLDDARFPPAVLAAMPLLKSKSI